MGEVKFSHLAVIIIIVCFVFSIGYWRGQESMMTLHSSNLLMAPNNDLERANYPSDLNWEIALTDPLTSALPPVLITANSNDVNDIAPEALNTDILGEIAPDASATELLDFLVTIANSDNQDNMQFFAKTMDRLRDAVTNDPIALQALLNSFLQADVEAKSPYYIISVLQGSGIANKKQIFENLAQQLAADGTIDSQQKLLNLVSSTGMQEKNMAITDLITEIALYSNIDTSNRLYALDLLMPYQLNENQKQTVVNDLKLSINTMNEDQKSYAIENMMRFSLNNERQQMANEFLNSNNDLSTRIAVLSSLHSGSLSPSGKLKTQLFEIAKDTSDPLSNHAKHALMNVFDITNDEYKTLNSGG